MKLFYSPTSPFVRKVSVFAMEAGLEKRIDRVVTNPWSLDAALLAENPLSKVPTLVTDDGMVLFDSPVICEYLDTLNNKRKLIPMDGAARWSALRLQALADGLLDAAVLRFLERKKEASQRSAEWDGLQQAVVERALDFMETDLVCWPAEFTVGQIAAACALGYLDFRFAEENWRGRCPRLAIWYGVFAQRRSMAETLPKVA